MLYGEELARIHHDHFGMVARAAAGELLARLGERGLASGTVIDLAAGSGILARAASEAGFDVLGVDLSPDMLRLARAEAPRARFSLGSLWELELPPCVAVAAVGEAFGYAADPTAGPGALAARLDDIRRALAPGGVLLFDVAGPGRSGPAGRRSVFWEHGGQALGLVEREADGRLERSIALFVPEGGLHRRVEETHALVLYAPEAVEAALARAGFSWQRLGRYGSFELLPGWHAWAATPR